MLTASSRVIVIYSEISLGLKLFCNHLQITERLSKEIVVPAIAHDLGGLAVSKRAGQLTLVYPLFVSEISLYKSHIKNLSLVIRATLAFEPKPKVASSLQHFPVSPSFNTAVSNKSLLNTQRKFLFKYKIHQMPPTAIDNNKTSLVLLKAN